MEGDFKNVFYTAGERCEDILRPTVFYSAVDEALHVLKTHFIVQAKISVNDQNILNLCVKNAPHSQTSSPCFCWRHVPNYPSNGMPTSNLLN